MTPPTSFRTALAASPWRRRARRSAAVLGVAVVVLFAEGSAAHETDQYSVRDASIADSTDLFNQVFNRRLGEIADRWLGGPDRLAFARRVYGEMGGFRFIDHYEHWARHDPRVEMLRLPRADSIYRGGPFWETRVVFFYGLGPVIRLNDELVGVDKISHFLSLGFKYYRRYLGGSEEDAVVGIGKRNEAGIFGLWTTGVYSNADLVANYEGFRFYRSLFEDDVVEGKPALIEWLGAGARRKGEFDWRDHVNAYWDEALNPSLYDGLLRERVHRNLEPLCDDYFESPEAFDPPAAPELEARYAHLGMRDASRFSLSSLCEVETARVDHSAAGDESEQASRQ